MLASAPPVAIIGIGCLFPKAADRLTFWSNVLAGTDAIGPVPASHFNPTDYLNSDPKAPDCIYTARGGFLDPVDFPPLEFGITPSSLEATDPTQLLGLWVARAALHDAGYDSTRVFDRSRASVILGVTGTLPLVIPLGARLGYPLWKKALAQAGVPEHQAQAVVNNLSAAYVGWQEDSFPGLLGNVVAGRIANRLDLHGTNCVVDAACASSLSAVHLALLELQSGRSDLVLSGGMDCFNDVFMYMCFSKTPALSPSGDARPFDANGDGTILGEGLGCVVLKRLEDAQRDGDHIYAIIRAVGTSSDGKGTAIYAPNSAGQARALRTAYRLAGISPLDVELVEAHGTGTRAGDAAELSALIEVYREAGGEKSSRPWCALGSIKSQIGHTKAAAGIAGLIKATLALHHRVQPPTIKVRQPLAELLRPDCPFFVNTQPRPWVSGGAPRRAAVSSFGFGGSNFHCVLEEAGADDVPVSWNPHLQILALSASSVGELQQKVREFRQAAERREVDWAAARLAFDRRQEYRLVFVLETAHLNNHERLAQAEALILEKASERRWSTPWGVYFGQGAPPGRLALLFPGQGSQYVGMLRDLACRFPSFVRWLELGNQATSHLQEPRLSDRIYPTPAFTPESAQQQEQDLRRTDAAQPALAVLSAACLELLRQFGVTGEGFAGHSFGELVALFAAGCCSEQELLALAASRGRVMAQNCAETSGMSAIRADSETIRRLLAASDKRLHLANDNAPNQVVVAGRTGDLAAFEQLCEQQGLRVTRLPVAAAFHTPDLTAARGQFGVALQQISLKAPRWPVYANLTAQPHPDFPPLIADQLSRQLSEPVRFREMIERMYADGFTTFVEIGPGSKLTGLVQQILPSGRAGAVALDSSNGKQPGLHDLARLLAQLAAWGYSVDLTAWCPDRGKPRSSKHGLTVPICGALYRKARSNSAEGSTPSQSVAPPLQGEAGAGAAEPAEQPTAPSSSTAASEAPAPDGAAFSKQPSRFHSKGAKNLAMATPNQNTHSAVVPPPGGATPAAPLAREVLFALQKIAEQTAQLHRQFLQGQERALEIFQQVLGGASTLPALTAPAAASNELLSGSVALAATSHPAGDIPMVSPASLTSATPPVTARAYQQQEGTVRDTVASHSALPSTDSTQTTVAATGAAAAKTAAISAGVPEQAASLPSGADASRRSTQADFASTLRLVVAEKTGYPADMLGLDMELDADLGIDSIKRVEIFAALQDRLPGARAVKPEDLGRLRTLRDVLTYVCETQSPEADLAECNGGCSARQVSGATESASIEHLLLGIVADKTGYPADMLNLDMELDADLGIDSIKRVEIFATVQEKLPSAPVIKPEHLGSLRTLRQVVMFLQGSQLVDSPAQQPRAAEISSPHESQEQQQLSMPTQAKSIFASESIEPGLIRYRPLAVPAPRRHGPALFSATQDPWWVVEDDDGMSSAVAQALREKGWPVRLDTAVRLLQTPVPDRLAGLVLAVNRRQGAYESLPRLLGLVQHAASSLRNQAVVAALVRLDGQFGWKNGLDAVPWTAALAGLVKTLKHEWTHCHVKLVDMPAIVEQRDQLALAVAEELLHDGPMEVGLDGHERWTVCLKEERLPPAPLLREPWRGPILITGGARGVTAACTLALARQTRCPLILLGRTTIVDEEPEWLRVLQTPAEISEALRQREGIQTPRQLQKRLHAILAAREVRGNLAKVRAAGVSVAYYSVDLRDSEAVTRLLAEARAEMGAIETVIHGAGVLADRRIEDLTADEWREVWDTKVTGLENVLHALRNQPLGRLAIFSSTTARFGRSGQAAYAMANETLNKIACRERLLRSDCQVLAINWGPWEGGMVSAGHKALFEKEGIALIPLASGAEHLLCELASEPDKDSPAEVVVVGGPLPSALMKEEASSSLSAEPPVLRRSVSIAGCPILADHVLKGKAVLPVALMMDWLGQAALQRHPGLVFHGLDQVQVLKGLTLTGHEEQQLDLFVTATERDNGTTRAQVRLVSSLQGRRQTHAVGHCLLVSQLPASHLVPPQETAEAFSRSPEQLYAEWLFHGLGLRTLRKVQQHGTQVLTARLKPAPPPKEWLTNPWRSQWLCDPLALDGGFQLAIVWTQWHRQVPCLPTSFGRYRQYVRYFSGIEVDVRLEVESCSETRLRGRLTWSTPSGQVVAEMVDYEAILDAGLTAAFRDRVLNLAAI